MSVGAQATDVRQCRRFADRSSALERMALGDAGVDRRSWQLMTTPGVPGAPPSPPPSAAGNGPTLPKLLWAGGTCPEVAARGSPPPVPALAIRRPRLEQLIDEAPDRHVVLVHGPAGAGKTVLVAQWLAARGSRCAWVSVDRSRDRPEAFLRRLTEAVARLAPEQAVNGSCRSTTELDHADPRDLLETIARPPGTGVDLVLDGVDRLLDSRCQDAVARLVEHPPPGARIVLVARAKPRLGIERARLRGDLVEIGPHALRFQRPEIDALAATWTDRVADAV